MRPIDYSKELWENQQAQIAELKVALAQISDSYLSIRQMIPGAFNTPRAPTPAQVYETTEQALQSFIEKNIKEEL
jgi:hypothetical protein